MSDHARLQKLNQSKLIVSREGSNRSFWIRTQNLRGGPSSLRGGCFAEGGQPNLQVKAGCGSWHPEQMFKYLYGRNRHWLPFLELNSWRICERDSLIELDDSCARQLVGRERSGVGCTGNQMTHDAHSGSIWNGASV